MKESELAALRSGKKAIGVVAPTEIKRRQIVDALHLLKFPDIRSYANYFDLAVDVDKQVVQWIYCTYYDQEGEGLAAYLPQMLAGTKQPLYTVVMVKDSEQTFLPLLFNHGLLHWIEAAEAPDVMAQSFYTFIKQFDSGSAASLQAFTSFRNYLKGEKRWSEIVETAENLLKFYPLDDVLRLQHIEALAKMGELGRARSLLLDFDLYDSNLMPFVTKLREALLQEGEGSHKLIALQFNMQSALIVDPLAESLQLIEGKCRELGFREIYSFKDGEAAAAQIKKQPIDFAIIEWQSPGVAGPFLIQRIREEGYIDIPIIVITDNLERADIQLVKDMGVAQVLKRPLNIQQLTIAAAWAIGQTKNPTEALSLERKIMSLLAQGDNLGAQELFRKLQTISSRDPVKDLYIKACFAYQKGHFLEAKRLLVEATRTSNGDNVNIASQLAKCLIRLGDTKAALSLLKRVTSFSPKNIERLCTLACTALEENDLQLAEESLIQAEEMDGSSNQVQETKVKVALVGGQTQMAGDLIKLIKNVDALVGHLNNLGVVMARTLDLTEAIRHYKNCLKIIPQQKLTYRAIVAYNLGLSLIKNKEPQLGSVYIKQAVDQGQSPVYARADSLYRRLLEARQSGKNFELRVPLVLEPMAPQEQLIEQLPPYADIEKLRRESPLLKGMVPIPDQKKIAS